MVPTTADSVEFSLRDEVREFHMQVATAQTMGEGFIEADERVMRQVLPTYNGKDGYFMFQGVRVYEKGKRDEVEDRESKTHEQLHFGGAK